MVKQDITSIGCMVHQWVVWGINGWYGASMGCMVYHGGMVHQCVVWCINGLYSASACGMVHQWVIWCIHGLHGA